MKGRKWFKNYLYDVFYSGSGNHEMFFAVLNDEDLLVELVQYLQEEFKNLGLKVDFSRLDRNFLLLFEPYIAIASAVSLEKWLEYFDETIEKDDKLSDADKPYEAILTQGKFLLLLKKRYYWLEIELKIDKYDLIQLLKENEVAVYFN